MQLYVIVIVLQNKPAFLSDKNIPDTKWINQRNTYM